MSAPDAEPSGAPTPGFPPDAASLPTSAHEPEGVDHLTAAYSGEHAPPGEPDHKPQRIGRFEVRRFLGEGAFGRVYEAFDPSLKRAVALKVGKRERLASATALERFHREARAAANLLHANIVAVFDHGEDAGQHYIASAFVAGHALDRVLARRAGPLPLREAATIARRLAEALAYAHRAGVVHRDVKPANVLLRPDGEPLLMDFGLAARQDEQDRLTQDGAVLGTFPYMAPEQWRGGAGAASDQYSLGCVLFELLTGHLPFAARAVDHWMYLHLSQAPPPPHELRPEVPPDLETICLKCLEKEPPRRYPDCQALADDLRRWLDGEPVTARRPGPGERLLKWARRSPAVASLLAAVLVVLTAGVAVSTALWMRAADALESEQHERSRRALAQVEALLTASPQAVPAILKGLADQPDDVLPRLRQVWNEADPRRRMRAALALLPAEPDAVRHELVEWMLQVPDPAELLAVRDVLRPHGPELRGELWRRIDRPGTTQGQKLRLLAALAAFDPTGAGWGRAGPDALEAWLADNPLYLGAWTEALLPARDPLMPALTEVFQGKRLPLRQVVAASILADYLADRPEHLADRLADAEPAQFSVLFEALQKQPADRVLPALTKEVRRTAPAGAKVADREELAKRQANAGLALAKLGRPEPVWPLLRHSPYPEARSRLVVFLGQAGVEARAVADRLEVESDVSARRALILALGGFGEGQLPGRVRGPLTRKLLECYRDDPDAGVHGAIDWLLRHGKEGLAPRPLDWGQGKELERIDQELAAAWRARWRRDVASQAGLAVGGGPLLTAAARRWRRAEVAGSRGWYVNGQGQTFSVIDSREPFLMGSPEDEAGRHDDETMHWRVIGRRYALQAKPVTVAEYQRFRNSHSDGVLGYTRQYSPVDEGPVIGVTWYNAAMYCRWLSEREGVPEHEMVYPPVGEILQCANQDKPLKLPADYLARTGYRLPTEAEWEFACRAGAESPRYYGSSPGLLSFYCWYQDNSQDRAWPVGQKRPNDLGCFDMHGNVWTWSQESAWPYPAGTTRQNPAPDQEDDRGVVRVMTRAMRGGSFANRVPFVRAAFRQSFGPSVREDSAGLRVARTLGSTAPPAAKPR